MLNNRSPLSLVTSNSSKPINSSTNSLKTSAGTALGVQISALFEKGKEPSPKVAESVTVYGKRSRLYDEIIVLLDKLPDAVVKHYKTILSAEVAIRNKGL